MEVPKDIVWDIKLLNLEKEKRIVLFGPKGIHLLNLSSGKVKTIFTSHNGYYLSPVETIDINHDGFDEFFLCISQRNSKLFRRTEVPLQKTAPRF